MVLRDIDAYHAWIEREVPSRLAQRIALDFLVAIGRASYTAPSVPIEVLSNRPVEEVRQARRPVPDEADVGVWYRVTYGERADQVDVIDVTQR